jgi:hypothetical protein
MPIDIPMKSLYTSIDLNGNIPCLGSYPPILEGKIVLVFLLPDISPDLPL